MIGTGLLGIFVVLQGAATGYAMLTRDLPSAVKPVAPAEIADPDRFGGEPTSSGGFALLGGFERKGGWVVPGSFTAFAMLGGGDIDLRQAKFAEKKVVIRAWQKDVSMAALNIDAPLLPRLSLSPLEWVAVVCVPLFATVIAMIAARITVLRTLARGV